MVLQRCLASSIPSKSPTSLFATRAAQRQKRLQAEARVTEIESTVRKTPEPASPPPRSVISRASQRSHVKDEERRSSGGSLRPQTDANIRQRRPSNAVAKSAPVDYRQRERSRSARPRRVTEETLPDGGVELGETAAPSVLHADFNETDLSELFSSPVPAPSIARSSVAQSHIDVRMQLLKEHAGDYSQYLPRDTDPTTLTVGSVDYVKLILARRRDVGLKPRHTAVELMREAGVNSTSGMQDFTALTANANQSLT